MNPAEYAKKRRAELKAKGLCTKCKKPSDGAEYCSICADFRKKQRDSVSPEEKSRRCENRFKYVRRKIKSDICCMCGGKGDGVHFACKKCRSVAARTTQGWNKKNRSRRNIFLRNKRKTNLSFKLERVLRSRLWNALHSTQKGGSAVRDLGCGLEEFKGYIANKFQRGMTWENYGEWHLDHVIPLASFDLTSRNQFLKACHYKNMQPLWAKDNLRKGARLEDQKTLA